MSDHFGNIPIQTPKPASPPKKKEPPAPPPPKKTAKGQGRTSRKEKARQRPKSNQFWLWALGLGLIVGLYAGIGFFGIPYYVGRNLPESFKETTGLTLEPGEVSFNPFTFRFVAENARILPETGPDLLSLKSLSADLAPLSLLRRDLVSNAINIDGTDLNITRELDGTYNFDPLLRRKKAEKTSEIMDFSDLPFFFSLNNIAIRNSKILFNDLPASKTHTITDIQLDLPAFSNIPFRANNYIHPRFSAVINGSPVELTGQAHVGKQGEPNLNTDLSCELHELDLPIYSEYLPVDLPMAFKKGKADGRLDFHFNPEANDKDKLSVSFDLKIADTELQVPDESLLITSSSTQLSGRLQPVAKTLHFTAISFTEPDIRSYGESFFKNINILIKGEKKSSKAEAEPAPLVVATDALDFVNGSFSHYRKQENQKPELSWKALKLQVKDYSSVARGQEGNSFGTFNITGEKENGSASFAWQGDFTSPENLKGTLKLAKMDFSELLKALGLEKKEFDVQGTAELNGDLAFPFSSDSAAKTGYKLTDAELAVENFKLLENKQAILTAPLLKAVGLNTAGNAVDWGNISLKNGVAIFSTANTPGFFKDFNSDKNRIQGLDLEGQATLVPDKKGKQKIQFTSVSLKADNLQTPEKAKNNFALTGQTSTGGTLSGQGDMRLTPFALAAKTEFSGLASEDVFPLFTDSEFFNSLSGGLAGKGTLSFPQQAFAGDLRIAKGQVQKGGKALYSWEDSVLQGVNYSSKPFHLEIALAAVDRPEYTWQIDGKDADPMQQLAEYFQQNLPTDEKQTGDKSKDLSGVEIQEFRLAGGRVRIQDNRMKPKWQGQVTEFSGSIKDIKPPTAESAAGDFSFTGKLDEIPLSVEGKLNLFARTQHGGFRAKLEGYPLSAFHKQLAGKTDIDTREGDFNLTLDAMWQDGKLRNTGTLLFSGVRPVSEKVDSALPLALLTGPEDIFQLDFDLQRSVPVAKTILAEEIISTWQTQTVKAAVSPLLLASGDFSDLIGNEYAEFLPGEFMLSDNGREALTRYSALLLSHPYLGLILSGGVDKELDGEAIKKQLEEVEQQRVDALNQKRLEEWQARKEAYEKKMQEPPKTGPNGKIIETTIPPDILAGFTPVQPDPVVVQDSTLLELAQKRLDVVHQYFTTQLTLEEHRITLTPMKKMVDVENSVNGVKIGLKAIKR